VWISQGVETSGRGKRKRVYPAEDYRTPYEKLTKSWHLTRCRTTARYCSRPRAAPLVRSQAPAPPESSSPSRRVARKRRKIRQCRLSRSSSSAMAGYSERHRHVPIRVAVSRSHSRHCVSPSWRYCRHSTVTLLRARQRKCRLGGGRVWPSESSRSSRRNGRIILYGPKEGRSRCSAVGRQCYVFSGAAGTRRIFQASKISAAFPDSMRVQPAA
jgi:hypothetical protein